MTTVVITQRVYLDAEGRVTTDPERAVSLWATPGMEVPADEAKAVGWPVSPLRKMVKAPAGHKMVGAPKGDK